MEDTIIRGYTKNGHFKIAFISYAKIINELKKIHNTSPIVTKALSRFVGSSLLLSTNLKEKEQYSFLLKCEGNIQGIASDVDSNANIRVLPYAPHALLDNDINNLNLEQAILSGTLNVIKWRKDQSEPYRSTIDLPFCNIGKDFNYYLTTSEQIPSAIMLSEYLEKDTSISSAAGLLIQTMPGAEENEIGFLETTISMNPSLNEMMLEGYSVNMIFDKILGIMEFEKLAEYRPSVKCNCTAEKVESALISMGIAELTSLFQKDENVILNCEYCKKEYIFSKYKIKNLINEIQSTDTNTPS